MRERPSDFPLLLWEYVARYAEMYKLFKITFSDTTLKQLKSYAWPGNIHEMENCVNYLTCLQRDPHIEPCDLPLLNAEEIAHAHEGSNGMEQRAYDRRRF